MTKFPQDMLLQKNMFASFNLSLSLLNGGDFFFTEILFITTFQSYFHSKETYHCCFLVCRIFQFVSQDTGLVAPSKTF